MALQMSGLGRQKRRVGGGKAAKRRGQSRERIAENYKIRSHVFGSKAGPFHLSNVSQDSDPLCAFDRFLD